MNKLLRELALLFAAAVPLTAGAAASQPAEPRQIGADLRIQPRRAILNAERPAAEFTVTAPVAGGEFDVSFIDRIMAPDGALVPREDALRAPELRSLAERHRSARPFIAMDAERLTLRPGEGRTISVRLRGPAPPAGEYRTHLTVTARDPNPPPAGTEGPATMLWAQSAPVFVRIGPVDIRAAIEDARLERLRADDPSGGPAVALDLVRRGRNSLFGDVTVSAHGRAIAVLNGVGVYPEIDRRRIVIRLPGLPPAPGTLEVAFTDRDTRPGEVLATARVAGGDRALAAVGAKGP
ncbi:hypothetical protein [Phenylobacterium sp.]|uniref:hypothetical protein n=1 Tax=Phenylobacterium sp. TaxID=1871053 RepID=UPI00391C9F5F